MDRTELKEVIVDQNSRQEQENLVDREIFSKVESYIKNDFVIIISGIRRCGKSALLFQIRKKHSGYYLNFDDERLINFKIEDFKILEELFIELYGEKKIYYFDEIQNIPIWERFVRRLHDERKKVFITGSNASMLSKELGTHLTGRYLMLQMFPFSFKEFLSLKKFEIDEKSAYLTVSRAKIKKNFSEYFISGGFPEYLKELNTDYLKTLYENIVYRDILVRYKIPNEKSLKELANLAINSISKEISFNSIKKILGLGSSTTVKDYFDYLENSFIIFLIFKFDYSLRKQMYYNKKVYCIDNGLAKYLGFRVTPDNGKLLENIVFIELKRRAREIYYYSDKKECDFVVKKGSKITQVIQCCYELTRDNKEREIAGLTEAIDKFKLKEGIILTYDQEEEIVIKGNKKVIVKPVWKWLLEKSE
ncbi:MAG: ATP-binding protein [Nanoarchaeota archaeon]